MGQEEPRRRRSGLLLAIAVAVALLAASCGSKDVTSAPKASAGTTIPSVPGNAVFGPADDPSPTGGGKVVFGIEAEPEGLDPTRYVFSSSGHSVASAVFDPLATLDASGKAVPYLATSITGSDGNKTWTIELPSDVKFHDGSALTAQVVVDNFEAYRKSLITGLALQFVTTVEATDRTHVVVKLSQPWAAFTEAMTSQLGYVLSPGMLKDPNSTAHPVGTGPFVFVSHVKDKNWVFKKNPDYWRKGHPFLDDLVFEPIVDNDRRVSKLTSGDLDVMHTARPQQILNLRTRTDLKRVENSSGEENFLILNTQKAPFDNIDARMAVAYATDREALRHEVGLDVPALTNSPFAPGQPGYLEDNGFPKYDLEKARQLVEKYKKDTGLPFEFTYTYTDDVDDTTEAQFLGAGFERAGMKMGTQPLPQINLVATTATGAYQLGRFRNFGFPSPDSDSVFWRSTSVKAPPNVSLNFPRLIDQKVDDAINKALASTDAKVRDEAYQEMSREWAKQIPYVFLDRPVWVLVANPWVNGIGASANGSIQTIGAKTWMADLWVSKK